MKREAHDNTRKDDKKKSPCTHNDRCDCKDKHKAPPDGAAVRKESGVE